MEGWAPNERPPVELAGGGPAGVVDPNEMVGFAGVVAGPDPGVLPPALKGELFPLPKRALPPPAPPKMDG